MKYIKQVNRPPEKNNWLCFGRTMRIVARKLLMLGRKAQKKRIKAAYRKSVKKY